MWDADSDANSLVMITSTKASGHVSSVALSNEGSRIAFANPFGNARGSLSVWSWRAGFPPELDIVNTTILRASAAEGAAIYLGAGRASLHSCTLAFCHASSSGALAVDGGNLTLESVCAVNNSAQLGAAVWLHNTTFDIRATRFEHNQAPVALQYESYGTTASLANSTFMANEGATTVLAAAPINWTCVPGTWMSATGKVTMPTFSGCPYDCAAGFVGNITDATLSTCGGAW